MPICLYLKETNKQKKKKKFPIIINVFISPNLDKWNLKLHYANLLALNVEWWDRTTNAKKHCHNSTSLSQTFTHNENLNKYHQSAIFHSLASRLLIILKSLNTNRIQVQAQLSHTRPI